MPVLDINRKAELDDVLGLIGIEREFQNDKHGSIEDAPHEVATWILLIEAELYEAKQAVIKGGVGRDSWRYELVQVAALCCAALEQHGINNMQEGRAI